MQRRVILIVCTVVLRQQFIQRNLHRKETKINPLIEMKLNAIKTRSATRNKVRSERFGFDTTTTIPRPTATEQTTTAPRVLTIFDQKNIFSTMTEF